MRFDYVSFASFNRHEVFSTFHCKQNDGFAEMIYDFNWYKLPIEYQKDIYYLIQRKQNGPKITAGPFGDYNRELFKVVRSVHVN